MICQINQPNGLGDILFCLKIGIKLADEGYDVYWPVIDWYHDIKNYISHPNLHFHHPPDYKFDISLDLQQSIEYNHPYDVMTCKYRMLEKNEHEFPQTIKDIECTDWYKYINPIRNIEKENDLYYNVLGLKDGEEYVFLNINFARGKRIIIPKENIERKDLKVVLLNKLSGFSLFDWRKVAENAVEIQTIDTSINYLLEIWDLKPDKYKVYPRHPEHTKKCLSTIFTKAIWMD